MTTISTYEQTKVLRLPKHLRFQAINLCFLSAFITGGFAAAIGLISPQVAYFYKVDVSNIVYIDILNIVGLLIGNFLCKFSIEKFGCYSTLVIAIIMGIFAQFIIALGFPLSIYALCALINGASLGLLVPTVTQTISVAYDSHKKESKITLLNFFSASVQYLFLLLEDILRITTLGAVFL